MKDPIFFGTMTGYRGTDNHGFAVPVIHCILENRSERAIQNRAIRLNLQFENGQKYQTFSINLPPYKNTPIDMTGNDIQIGKTQNGIVWLTDTETNSMSNSITI